MTSQALIESDVPSCSTRSIQVYKMGADLKEASQKGKETQEASRQQSGDTAAARNQDLGERARGAKRDNFL